jgi:hypothetical protein
MAYSLPVSPLLTSPADLRQFSADPPNPSP